MIKIGIDPSGTGTTGIVEFNKIRETFSEEHNSNWKEHYSSIIYYINHINNIFTFIDKTEDCNIIINIENCLYTNANGSKDRDDLLRLLGAVENKLNELQIHFNWVSPCYTKSVVNLSMNMENLSKYQQKTAVYKEDNLLTYQYGKGWKYNNEKISNHLRDAIIIANYER